MSIESQYPYPRVKPSRAWRPCAKSLIEWRLTGVNVKPHEPSSASNKHRKLKRLCTKTLGTITRFTAGAITSVRRYFDRRRFAHPLQDRRYEATTLQNWSGDTTPVQRRGYSTLERRNTPFLARNKLQPLRRPFIGFITLGCALKDRPGLIKFLLPRQRHALK